MNPPAPFTKAVAAARELAEALAELARESDRAPGPAADIYDSAHLPPRTSRRWFAEICRSGRVDGATQEGRVWVCSPEAWHAARARKNRDAGPVRTEAAPSLVTRADALLERSGLRLLPPNLPRDPKAG
jgi:hypothetical protein